MLEYFYGLRTRGKVIVLVVVMFVAIMAVAIPIIIIREQILLRRGRKNLKEGNLIAAFTAFRRLLEINFCSDPIFSEAAKSSAEIAIAGMQQALSQIGVPAVLQQIINIHREAARLHKQKSAVKDDQQKKGIDSQIEQMKERGLKLFPQLTFPISGQSSLGQPVIGDAGSGAGGPLGDRSLQGAGGRLPEYTPASGLGQQVPIGTGESNQSNMLSSENGLPPISGSNPGPLTDPLFGNHLAGAPQELQPLPPSASVPQIDSSQSSSLPPAPATGSQPAMPVDQPTSKIKIKCTCGKTLLGGPKLRGRIVKCPSCGISLKVE